MTRVLTLVANSRDIAALRQNMLLPWDSADASSLSPHERMKLKVRQHTYFRVHSVHSSMYRIRFQTRSYLLSLAHVIFICMHDLAAAWGRSEGSENGALCSTRSHWLPCPPPFSYNFLLRTHIHARTRSCSRWPPTVRRGSTRTRQRLPCSMAQVVLVPHTAALA